MTSILYGARDFYDAQKVLNNPAAKERFLNMCSDGIYNGWPVRYLIDTCWTEWQEVMDLVVQIHEELDTVDIDLIRDMLPEKYQREKFDFHDRLLYICDQTWPTWIKSLMDTMNANAISEEEFVAECEELERQEATQALLESAGIDSEQGLDSVFSEDIQAQEDEAEKLIDYYTNLGTIPFALMALYTLYAYGWWNLLIIPALFLCWGLMIEAVSKTVKSQFSTGQGVL